MVNTNNATTRLPAADAKSPLDALIGSSPAMQRMFRLIEQVAATRLTVLVTGDTGTGKELVAKAVHQLSDRGKRQFVTVNCSAIPETLIEAELFGYTRGSFTGAVATRRGLMEEAHGGSLFIDEISTLTPQTQVTLLRVLEDRTIRKVGSSQSVPVNFRLIVASNEDLARKVEQGKFREDLYYRLKVFPIEVPPLRDRREDIPLLAEHFRRLFAHEYGIVPPPFAPSMLERLAAMDWPGNVRELEHFVQRAIVLRLSDSDIRCVAPLQCRADAPSLLTRATNEEWSLERLEHEYIRRVMERTLGRRGQAAAVLGIDRRTLYRKLLEVERENESVRAPELGDDADDEQDSLVRFEAPESATRDSAPRNALAMPSAPARLERCADCR
ncbi:MAG: sigma-54 dependent transcriptional regulator [Gemmatimonadota bacterium]